MVLNSEEILKLIEEGILLNANPDAISSASIDLHIGGTILKESPFYTVINYRNGEKKGDPLTTYAIEIPAKGFILEPGEFILAHTIEVFNLPRWLSGEYKLKSSMARIGIDHANAGWCDAGWNGSALTLEIKNQTQHHAIRIRKGDPIGQMVFYPHKQVPEHRSYAVRGSYNGDGQTVKGVKS